ncbi:MAG: hypothetical protein AB1586_30950 [Pseudomonadota bacterium]|jgi:hypothetical protein
MKPSGDTEPTKPRRGLKVFLWGAAGLVALAAIGGAIGKSRLDEVTALARESGIKFGSVGFDWSGHIHLHEVALPLRDGRAIEAADIVLRPRLLSYGGELHGTNVRIDVGAMKWTLPQIDMEHASLDLATMRGMFGGGAEKTLAQRIAQFEAARILIPSLQMEQVTKRVRQSIVYEGVVLETFANGRIANFSARGGHYNLVSDLAGLDGKQPQADLTGSLGAMTVRDVDVANTARLYTEAARPGEESIARLNGAFSLKDFLQQAKEGIFTIGEVRGEGLSVRLLAKPLLAILDDMGKVKDPESLPAAERQAYYKQMVSVLDMFAQGDIELRAIGITPITTPGKSDDVLQGGIERAGIRFSDHKLDLAMSHVMFTGSPSDKLSVGSLEVKGFSWAPTIAALEKDIALGQEASGRAPVEALIPDFGSWRIEDLAVDLPRTVSSDSADEGDGATDPSPAQKRVKFSLKSGELRMAKPVNGIPSSFRSAVTDLVVNSSEARSPVFDILRELGYAEVATSFALDVNWHEADETLAIDEVSLSAKDMGGIRLSGSVGGFKRDLFTSDPEKAQEAALNLTGRALTVRIEDSGLFDRVLTARGKKAKLSAAQTRATLANMAREFLHETLGEQAKVRDLDTAISGFIAKPGILQLSVKAKAGEGISLKDLATVEQDPDDFLAKIDMSVTRQ